VDDVDVALALARRSLWIAVPGVALLQISLGSPTFDPGRPSRLRARVAEAFAAMQIKRASKKSLPT
jgi:hypothetical protein